MMLIYIKCKKDKKKDIPCDTSSLTENIYDMSTNNTSFTKGIRIWDANNYVICQFTFF